MSDALGTGETGVFTLHVGDCLNDASEVGDVSTVPVVDCDTPHDSEVYASVMMQDAEYPGAEATVAAAGDACRTAFERFIGIPAEDSIYSFASLYPTESSWDGGDREILCRVALAREDGTVEKVSGSLEGKAE
jgi:hypothetical protein